MLSTASGETTGELVSRAKGRSLSRGRGQSTGLTRSQITTEGITETAGTSSSLSRGFTGDALTGQASESTTQGQSHQLASSRSTGESTSTSTGSSETSGEAESWEETRSEYLRPVLRTQDIISVFNQTTGFIYWVKRGLPPLCDFDGRPIAVRGMYAMPKHVYEKRDAAPWPRMPGKSILPAEDYLIAKIITEEQMVRQCIDQITGRLADELIDPY